MKIYKALETLLDRPKEHLWCRPVSWQGTGAGLAIKEGRVLYVPSARGGVTWYPALRDLLDVEWEVLDSSDVLSETAGDE